MPLQREKTTGRLPVLRIIGNTIVNTKANASQCRISKLFFLFGAVTRKNYEDFLKQWQT
jgi:hypothetical protein